MIRSQARPATREVRGPGPYAIAVIAKPRLPPGHHHEEIMFERREKDFARDQLLRFNRNQKSCDLNSSWLETSERHILKGAVSREVQAALKVYETEVEGRRHRLQAVLAEEEKQLLQEVEDKMETVEERQEKMRVRANTLRERRERARQELVSEKLDKQFREQCQGVRAVLNRQRQHQVKEEQASLLRRRQQQLQQQQEEDQLFDQLWEADRRAKDEQEQQRAETQRLRDMEQLVGLDTQVEEAELKRRAEKEQKEEEFRLMRREEEDQRLLAQHQQRQKIQTRLSRQHELDQDFRMKMKYRGREQQDKDQLDMNIQELLLQQETDKKQKDAQKKVNTPEPLNVEVIGCGVNAVCSGGQQRVSESYNHPDLRADLCEEGRRYRKYLSDEQQRQRMEEEEMEQMIHEKVEENWDRKDEVKRLEQENRERIIKEVVADQRLQIQRNINLKEQKRAAEIREREEMTRLMEEMKVKDEEERRRERRRREEYELGLRQQVKEHEQLRSDFRAQTQKEEEQTATLRQINHDRILQVLAAPIAHTAATHPFRRGTSSSALTDHHKSDQEDSLSPK
ncbi:cilia- and flagella-associated protein 53 [Limanda limanda]|uniref:cilia- and flagella-associated protein 53 n=1 Tax=Limanda limanda TaxID=27771 RepID=UPI0029C86E65|nr:cilia- and flagella-associated protein 53 [Limanda limanda]